MGNSTAYALIVAGSAATVAAIAAFVTGKVQPAFEQVASLLSSF